MEHITVLDSIDRSIWEWSREDHNRGNRPAYAFVSRNVWYTACSKYFQHLSFSVQSNTFMFQGVKVTWAPDLTDDQIILS